MASNAPYASLEKIFCAAIAALLLACLPYQANAGRLEAGLFEAHDTLGNNRTPDRVTFQQPFDTPPIVIAIPSSAGNNSASIRITNVTTTGFDELILEPDNWDGRHLAMDTYYIAVEPGRHVLPDGTVIEAGFINLTNVQFGTGFTGGVASWNNVTFSSPLFSTPLILHQLQTANSETRNVANQSSRPHITSIAQNPTTFGFQLAIERSQANSGPFPSSEQIGWIAFPDGANGSFEDIVGSAIDWSTRTTPANIRGWDDGCFSNPHGLAATAPIVVAKKTTRNNNDGGWLRYCSVTGTDISLRVDEDRDQDNERSVAAGDAERAALVAFSQSFHANLAADLEVSKARTAVNDGVGVGSGFEIPGARITYEIAVANIGNAPPNFDSVLVTEQLPADLDLVITDFAAPGSGPIQFEDGSPPTGLTCPFVSLADGSDCIAFSTDGVDYTYTPIDSGDGTDPAVRFVQIRPSGFMLGAGSGGTPQFTLRLLTQLR